MAQSSTSMLDGFLMASVLQSDVKKQTLISNLPNYIETPEFIDFIKNVDPSVN